MRLFIFLIFTMSFIGATAITAEPVNTAWEFDAGTLYDTGFMHMLMRNSPQVNRGDGGVRLFDMELVENDSPGAGNSEKGV